MSIKRIRDLAELTPDTRGRAEQLLARCERAGVPIMIIETYRTRERQEDLFNIGRKPCPDCVGSGRGSTTDPEAKCSSCKGSGKYGGPKIVTKVGPDGSWHETRRAFDVALLDAEGHPTWEDYALVSGELEGGTGSLEPLPTPRMAWDVVGEYGEQLGLTWGGRWGWDKGHFQNEKLQLAEASWLCMADELTIVFNRYGLRPIRQDDKEL